MLPTLRDKKAKIAQRKKRRRLGLCALCILLFLVVIFVCFPPPLDRTSWFDNDEPQIGSNGMGLAEEEDPEDTPIEIQNTHRSRMPQKYFGRKVAITSAYHGKAYEPIGRVSDITKRKYAELWGYDYLLESELLTNKMSWGQKSAIRTKVVKKHIDNYEWVYWSDSDVLIVDASYPVDNFIDDDYDVIMSRDWGDRQVNPGSAFFRSSETTKQILDVWDEYYFEVKDDLRAFQKLVKERPDWGERIKFIDQHQINAYPHLSFAKDDQKYNLPGRELHALWEEGDWAVHVVNCLRDPHNDNTCCAGLATRYFSMFLESFCAEAERRLRATDSILKLPVPNYEDFCLIHL